MHVVSGISRLLGCRWNICCGGGIKRSVGPTHRLGEKCLPAVARLPGLPYRHAQSPSPPIPKSVSVEIDFALLAPPHQDIGRLQVAVDDGRVGLVSEGHNLGQAQQQTVAAVVVGFFRARAAPE